MTTWEYKWVSVSSWHPSNDLIRQLNAEGAQGWEAVSTTVAVPQRERDMPAYSVLLKRPSR
ncbi:DUF4177 domain-containing protein [Kitasatospora sp. NPDC015120]|uniref:DUF4177 domain-containing protein n=1 Tax=Kitasatospora sp. NPDC015120 TaxID=3364023 RepID=UPI0036F47A71